MKTLLPRKYTLEQLLNADPLASLYDDMVRTLQECVDQDPEGRAAEQVVTERYGTALKEKPELREELAKCDHSSEGIRNAALLLGVTEEQLRLTTKFQERVQSAKEKVGAPATLIRSWCALKRKAGIKNVESKDFPKTLARPMLVLYSADWCPPCRMMRPTFARLVPFFDKAEVRYCHEEDWKWRQSQGVNGIPQFVAYFPNGARVNSDVGSTTKEIWDTMNALIMLGKSWEGKGELVCDEQSCKIVTLAQQ